MEICGEKSAKKSYPCSDEEINQLFVIGFASSCVFGPFSGALWDNYGRKLGILTYG